MAVHPLRPATDRRLGGPLPHQLSNQTRAHLSAINLWSSEGCPSTTSCGISTPFGVLFPTARQVTHALLTRPPLRHSILSTVEAQRFHSSQTLASHLDCSVNRVSPFDLHVLGAPPAFVLSQDQTLEKLYLNTLSGVKIIFQAKSQLVSKKLKSTSQFLEKSMYKGLCTFFSMLFNFQGPFPLTEWNFILAHTKSFVNNFFHLCLLFLN